MGQRFSCSSNSKKIIKQICETDEFKSLISRLYTDMLLSDDKPAEEQVARLQKQFIKSRYMSDLVNDL